MLKQQLQKITNSQEACSAIISDPKIFKHLKKFHGDPIVVKCALKRRTKNLKYASKELKDNEEIVEYMISRYGTNHSCDGFNYASTRLRNNKKLALKALKHRPDYLSVIDKKTKSKDFVLSILSVMTPVSSLDSSMRYPPNVYNYSHTDIPCNLRADKDIVELLINKLGPNVIAELSPAKQNKLDIKLVLRSVAERPCLYEYLTKELRAKDFIVIAALNAPISEYRRRCHRRISWFQHSPNELRDNLTIAEIAMKNRINCFRYFSESIKNNKKIAALALSLDINNYEYLSCELKKDISLINKVLMNLIAGTIKLNRITIIAMLKNGVKPHQIYKHASARQRRCQYLYIEALNKYPKLIKLEANLHCLLGLSFIKLNHRARLHCFKHSQRLWYEKYATGDVLEIATQSLITFEQFKKKILLAQNKFFQTSFLVNGFEK